MIYLDANIFLRYLATPHDEPTQRMQAVARALINQVQVGTIEATISEVVVHEVCYILGSKQHYGLNSAQIISLVRPLIRLRALRIGQTERNIMLRAFDIWERNLKLGFSDSIIAARCEANGWQLATFDKALASIPEVARWEPTTTE